MHRRIDLDEAAYISIIGSKRIGEGRRKLKVRGNEATSFSRHRPFPA